MPDEQRIVFSVSVNGRDVPLGQPVKTESEFELQIKNTTDIDSMTHMIMTGEGDYLEVVLIHLPAKSVVKLNQTIEGSEGAISFATYNLVAVNEPACDNHGLRVVEGDDIRVLDMFSSLAPTPKATPDLAWETIRA